MAYYSEQCEGVHLPSPNVRAGVLRIRIVTNRGVVTCSETAGFHRPINRLTLGCQATVMDDKNTLREIQSILAYVFQIVLAQRIALR